VIGWPDLAILAFVVVAALRGFKRGFVAEATGAVAIGCGIVAALRYDGFADIWIADIFRLGIGSAHIVANVVVGIATYLVVLLLAFVIGRVVKLPLVNLGNAALGVVLGIAKALVFAWAILYVALFFPLTKDARSDFHRSSLVHLVTEPNAAVDNAIKATIPWFVRPFVDPLFAGHRF
jgi:uncharacterized membrane protein required for colicin V production